MKKCMLLLLALTVFTISNAQNNFESGFAKGDMVISGNLRLEFPDNGSDNIEIAPTFGYFLTNNILLSAGPTYQKSTETSGLETSAFGIEVSGVYFFTPQKQFSFTAFAGLKYARSKTEISGTDVTSNLVAFSISPGMNYFLSNRVALAFAVGTIGFTSNSGATNVGFNIDLRNPSIGVVYRL